MAITAGIGTAVAGVGSGILSSIGAGKANKAAQGYYTQALNFEKGVYSDATTNLTPWISGGQSALSQYEGGLGLGSTTGGTSGSSNLQNYWNQFTKTPYYTFPLSQATTSMNQAAAAKGLSLSGGQLKDIGSYAADYSSKNWSSYMDALNKLSGVGESAATSLGNIGSNVAQTVAGTSNQQASTAAASIMGQYGGYSQALQGIAQGINTASSYGSGGSGSNSGSLSLSDIFNGTSNAQFSNQLSGELSNVTLPYTQGNTYSTPA